MRRARHVRGQSMVELALGAFVLITILIFGIHFAEVGYLTIKVQEAAANALWDTTAKPMHVMPGDFSPLDAATGAAPGEATARYQDFDGRTSQNNGASSTQVFTQAQGLQVSCQGAGLSFNYGSALLAGVFEDVGGFACRAQATVAPGPGFPVTFVEEFFGARHYDGPSSFTVCSIGRASGGSCNASFGLLLDDWGFSDSEHGQNCPLVINEPNVACAQNSHYYRSVQLPYNAYGRAQGFAATRLAEGVTQQSAPIDENGMFMSFTGSDWGDPFFDNVRPGEGQARWAVNAVFSPVAPYTESWNKRAPCWLGLGCGYNGD